MYHEHIGFDRFVLIYITDNYNLFGFCFVNKEEVVTDISPAVADAAPPKNVIATPMKIGFLGLGIMGSGMVNNLLISGHEVTVWNRSPAKVSSYLRIHFYILY